MHKVASRLACSRVTTDFSSSKSARSIHNCSYHNMILCSHGLKVVVILPKQRLSALIPASLPVDFTLFGYRESADCFLVCLLPLESCYQQNFLFMIYQIFAWSFGCGAQLKRNYYACEPMGVILPSRLI
jgi:hypothetical protein